MSTFALPLAIGFATSIGILFLVGLSSKYVIAAVLASPVALAFAVTSRKQSFLLAAIVLALPFAHTTFFLGAPPLTFHAGGAQSVAQVSIVDLLLLAAFAHSFLFGHRNQSIRSQAFFLTALSVVGFIAWCGFSIVLSDYKTLGLISLVDLLKVFLLWFYLASRIATEDDIDLVVKCLMFGLALQGAFGIYQAFFGFPQWASAITEGDTSTLEQLDTRTFVRVGGTLGWTTVFAQYLCLLIPLSLAKVAGSLSRRMALSYGVCTLLSIVALVFTLSRAGWISLALGSTITVVLLHVHGRKYMRRRLMLAFGSVLLIFAMFIPLLMERLSSDDYGSSAARIPMTRVAWDVIQQNPVFGTGLNTYSEIMHRYDPEHLIDGFDYPVHNLYLFIAAEVGIPGLVLFLVFVGLVMFGTLNAAKRGPEGVTVISAGLFGGFVAAMTQSLVEPAIKQDIQLWYVFSALCGLASAIGNMAVANSAIDQHQRVAKRV